MMELYNEILKRDNLARALFMLTFYVNDEEVTINVPPTKRLTDILRDDLQLTGTKVSCEMGRCGACMVLMNGDPVNSCLLMAYQAEGSRIETIENVANEELHPIQASMVKEGGFQCGYCTPGMVISIKGLLDNNPCPSYEEIVEGLSGNLCRCTGYSSIIRAVQELVNKKS
jgi:carbon-monoxide dehydrogenase small subunit